MKLIDKASSLVPDDRAYYHYIRKTIKEGNKVASQEEDKFPLLLGKDEREIYQEEFLSDDQFIKGKEFKNFLILKKQ